MYVQEQVSLVDGEEELEQWDASGALLATLDKAAQSPMVRSSQSDLAQPERKGLFWVLDELATSSSVSDTTLVDKLFTSYYSRGSFLSAFPRLLTKLSVHVFISFWAYNNYLGLNSYIHSSIAYRGGQNMRKK